MHTQSLPHVTQELQAHIDRKPPPLVYHYTGQHGLMGIVSSGKVWATSTNNLNDTQEFEHAKYLAIGLIASRSHTEADPTIKRHLGYLQTAAQGAGINICVASWSSVPDDLSQWRAYSQGGTGYSIDVTGALLSKLAVAQDFVFAACVYDEDQQQQLMDSLIDAALARNLANDHLLSAGDEIEKHLLEHNGGDFGYHLSRYAALFKHPSFAVESEWRLISKPMIVSRMEFRAGVSTIVSYYRFCLMEPGIDNPAQVDAPAWLNSVHVGPCAEPDLAKRKVEFLLAKHCEWHPRPDVYSSDVPYRSW